MSEEGIDRLQISIVNTKEVAADAADLSVTVKGASLLTGQMALHKAREVAQLVSSLADVGIGQEDIFLQGVSAETSNGALVKMSGASYRLRVHVAPLEKLADVLGVVTSQKSAALSDIAWCYPQDTAWKNVWLTACIAEANAKATRVAAALGVGLQGVCFFTERYADPSENVKSTYPAGLAESSMMRHARVSSEELGLEVTHTKTLTLQVDVQYRISGFSGAGS